MKDLYVSFTLGLIRGDIVPYTDARMLYMVLVSLAAKNGTGVVRGVKRSKLRELTGYSKDRISKCVGILRRSGLVSTKKIGGGRLEYSFPLGFAPDRVPKGIEITSKTLVSVNINTSIVLNKKLLPTARLLQVVLHSFPAKNKCITMGMEALQGYLLLSRRSICRYLFTLKRTNNIRVKRRKYDYNQYFIKFRGYGITDVGCFGETNKNRNKNKNILNVTRPIKKRRPPSYDDVPFQYLMDAVLERLD
jgi:hypothetical protein